MKKVLTIVLAGTEELIKFIAIYVIALRSHNADEPIDFTMYMITGAGFAALENALFLIDPITVGDGTVSLLTGNFRFLGRYVLHAISSGIIGIALRTFVLQKLVLWGEFFLWAGVIGTITLHATFNFLIINSERGLFNVLVLLWGVTIIVLLLFEQLRQM